MFLSPTVSCQVSQEVIHRREYCPVTSPSVQVETVKGLLTAFHSVTCGFPCDLPSSLIPSLLPQLAQAEHMDLEASWEEPEAQFLTQLHLAPVSCSTQGSTVFAF